MSRKVFCKHDNFNLIHGCPDCEFERIAKAEQDACDLEDVPLLRARIFELEAENDRLRMVLETLVDAVGRIDAISIRQGKSEITEAWRKARAALEAKP